jgi:hypothetical protein
LSVVQEPTFCRHRLTDGDEVVKPSTLDRGRLPAARFLVLISVQAESAPGLAAVTSSGIEPTTFRLAA